MSLVFRSYNQAWEREVRRFLLSIVAYVTPYFPQIGTEYKDEEPEKHLIFTDDEG